jgi:hypothetical protein
MTEYLGFAGIEVASQGFGGINPKYSVMATHVGISKRYPHEKKYHTFFKSSNPLG